MLKYECDFQITKKVIITNTDFVGIGKRILGLMSSYINNSLTPSLLVKISLNLLTLF